MVKWFNDSKVLEFYEGSPLNLNKVIEKYGPRSKPVGYMQYYEIQETELKKYSYPENQYILGIDPIYW